MTLLSTETWNQLDPHAGRLSPRDRRRVRIVLAAGLVLMVCAGYLWWSGLIRPRLHESGWGLDSASTPSKTFAFQISVLNSGGQTARVVGAGRSGPGLDLISVDGTPASLPSSTGVELTLRYRVTDCAAIPRDSWTIPVRVQRPWGIQTVWIAGPQIPADDAPANYSYSGTEDPYSIEWQQYAGRASCQP